MKRRITKAQVRYVSLVPKGANQMPVLYKSADQTCNFNLLTKAGEDFDERGELLAVVFAPEVRDSQGDIASAEVIKDMMHDFAKNGHGIDIRHDETPVSKDRAYVAEQFLIQKGDDRFQGFVDYSGKPVVVTGGWGMVIKVDDPDLRAKYRTGEWQGVSLMGKAQVEVEEATLADRVVNSLAKHLGINDSTSNSEDIDMDAKELEAILVKNNEALLKAATAAASDIIKQFVPGGKAPEKKEEPKKEESGVPVFKGEPTAENLRKHRMAVRKHQIISAIDWADADSVEKGEKALAEFEAEVTTKKEGEADPNAGKIAELEAQLASLRKGSNQPEGGTPATTTTISKETDDLVKIGKAMAQRANERRGYIVK